jgi:hypothetical protein
MAAAWREPSAASAEVVSQYSLLDRIRSYCGIAMADHAIW